MATSFVELLYVLVSRQVEERCALIEDRMKKECIRPDRTTALAYLSLGISWLASYGAPADVVHRVIDQIYQRAEEARAEALRRENG